MRKIRVFLLVLLVAGMLLGGAWLSYSADTTIDWDATAGATGYKVALSYDLGVTWTTPIDMKMVKPFTITGVPEDKLVLFKIAAYNANSEAWGNYRYAAVDYRKRPIAEPSGPGVK